MLDYTRSFRRRFFATILDNVLIATLFAVVSLAIASNLSSNFRGGMGLFHYNVCDTGEMFTPSHQKVKTDGWDGIKVCDTTLDFLFPYRTATIFKVTEETIGGTKTRFTRHITFQLNDKNEIVFPKVVGYYAGLLVVLLAAISECLFATTPGKKMLGLAVWSVAGDKISFATALLRNAIKYLALWLWSAWAIAVTPSIELILKSSMQADGSIKMPPEMMLTAESFTQTWWPYFALSIFLSLLMLSIPASIFFPLKRPGRGLHDRAARSVVTTTT